MRLSKQGIENIRRGLKRSWLDGSHRQRQQAGNIDADTLRSRALYDRKCTLIVSGVAIYHSTHRSDQLDVYVDGVLAVIGGPRVVAQWMAGQIK